MNRVFLLETGDLVVGKPFFFVEKEIAKDQLQGHLFVAIKDIPIGYALFGGDGCFAVGAYKHLVGLGLFDLGPL